MIVEVVFRAALRNDNGCKRMGDNCKDKNNRRFLRCARNGKQESGQRQQQKQRQRHDRLNCNGSGDGNCLRMVLAGAGGLPGFGVLPAGVGGVVEVEQETFSAVEEA
jgi:hypothetical protein